MGRRRIISCAAPFIIAALLSGAVTTVFMMLVTEVAPVKALAA
jgi:hypothetical protein